MSWAEGRQTTVKEDKAYSLLGIFGVHLPLIYGEGEANAFRRLEEEIDRPLATDRNEQFRKGKCQPRRDTQFESITQGDSRG